MIFILRMDVNKILYVFDIKKWIMFYMWVGNDVNFYINYMMKGY